MRRTFVVGCPRSGTTLVQAMIARHPDVFSLRETYFFESLLGDAEMRWGDREARPTRRWYHRAGMAQSWGRHRLRELERVHATRPRHRPIPRRWSACARRYAALLDDAASRRQRTQWVEKTPNHLLFLDEIANCIPDARFVHVLRRGIDVVASISDADMQVETRAFSGGTVRWARRWNRAMGMHLAHLGEPRHYLLCLEDLIGSADEEWRMLQEFLVLDPGKPLLGRPGCDVTDARTEPWKASAVSGIAKSMSGKSQAVFGPRSLAWLRQHLVSYGAIRDAIREQHRTNMDWTRHSVNTRGSAAWQRACGWAGPTRRAQSNAAAISSEAERCPHVAGSTNGATGFYAAFLARSRSTYCRMPPCL